MGAKYRSVGRAMRFWVAKRTQTSPPSSDECQPPGPPSNGCCRANGTRRLRSSSTPSSGARIVRRPHTAAHAVKKPPLAPQPPAMAHVVAEGTPRIPATGPQLPTGVGRSAEERRGGSGNRLWATVRRKRPKKSRSRFSTATARRAQRRRHSQRARADGRGPAAAAAKA